MYCHLRPPDANIKCFGAPGHLRPNSDGFIYVHYAAPPYSARIDAIYLLPLAKFGWVPFAVCNAWQRSNVDFTEVGEISGPILTRLWTKVHKIFGQCMETIRTFHFPAPLPDCLCHVSFRRYSPLSLEVVENRTNVSFWPDFFGRDNPDFLRK